MAKESTTNKERLDLSTKEQLIRQKFLTEASVVNYEKGYVSAPWVNQLIDPELQLMAADIIADWARNEQKPFDKVAGIPNSGLFLAAAVAGQLGIPLAPSRKGNSTPGSWRSPLKVEEDIPSFTTGETSTFAYNLIEPGENVLLIDDVIAKGYTSILTTNAFRAQGINVQIATYFAKLFQPGVNKLHQETGIDPFYVVGIETISPEKITKLSQPHY